MIVSEIRVPVVLVEKNDIKSNFFPLEKALPERRLIRRRMVY
jgi:hypothetical protein